MILIRGEKLDLDAVGSSDVISTIHPDSVGSSDAISVPEVGVWTMTTKFKAVRWWLCSQVFRRTFSSAGP